MDIRRRRRPPPRLFHCDWHFVSHGAEVTYDAVQRSFEELVMGKYIDKVPKLDLVTPGAEPEKAT